MHSDKSPRTQGYYRIKPFQQEKILRKQSTTKEFTWYKKYRFVEIKKVLEDFLMQGGTQAYLYLESGLFHFLWQLMTSFIAQVVAWNSFGHPSRGVIK